jgi:hypothetical protein
MTETGGKRWQAVPEFLLDIYFNGEAQKLGARIPSWAGARSYFLKFLKLNYAHVLTVNAKRSHRTSTWPAHTG